MQAAFLLCGSNKATDICVAAIPIVECFQTVLRTLLALHKRFRFHFSYNLLISIFLLFEVIFETLAVLKFFKFVKKT